MESGVPGPDVGKFIVWSPRNRRLAILLLYQARGNARISLSRRISYLKEADPISQTADILISVVSTLLADLFMDGLSKNDEP